MLSKITAVLVIGATLFTVPVFADTQSAPPPTTQTAGQGQEAKPLEPAAKPAEVDLNLAALGQSDIDYLNMRYVKGFFTDTGKVVTSPVRWDGSDWLKLGAVVGVTGSLMLVDQKVKEFAQRNQSAVASKFAMVGNDLGNGLYVLPPIGAFYLYGYLADDHKARRTALLAMESFAISGLMTEGLKALGGRHRPNTGDSPTTWDGPSMKLKNVSFSSGHTASAFSIATVFAEEYKDSAYIPALAYGLATLTGLSRIYSNEHWASDVFVGGALGYFTSKALLSFHKEDPNKLFGTRLTLLPAVGKQMTGLSVKYDF